MNIALKKLIEHIDQLVCWLKENSTTAIPSQEKGRIEAILKKILGSPDLSDEEWQKLKPSLVNIVQVQAAEKPKKATSTYLNANKNGKKERKSIPLPLSPPKKAGRIKEFTVKKYNKTIICPHCRSSVLQKNAAKHTSWCRAANHNSRNKHEKVSSQLYSKLSDNSKIEKQLDGSFGFHQFRENGRFGSHPSFDGMDDNSHP